MAVAALGLPTSKHLVDKARAYVALMKLRVIELLLVTTLPTMVLAAGHWPQWGSIVATLVGGTLAAGGANAINMVVDRDIDTVMRRTKHRPLVTGALNPMEAFVFALVIEGAAFVELWLTDNMLSAILAVCATAFYVFIYTLWLKRRSTQNIVIGGAAGAVPVLVGWAAVTDSLSWVPIALFAIIFVWTPPHFWALAVRYKDDYSAAKVPMLPSVKTLRRTTAEMLIYTVVLVALSILFAPLAHMGLCYLIVASGSGVLYLAMAARLWRHSLAGVANDKGAMALFHYSIYYLTILFVGIAVDVLIRAH